MGYWKQRQIEMIEDAAEEEKAEWIEDKFGSLEQGTVEWYKAEERYYDFKLNQEWKAQAEEDEENDLYFVKDKTRFEIFTETIESAKILNNIKATPQRVEDNLKIMLYGHVVAATEGYLSFTFIDKVLSDNKFLKQLVESDPEFAERSVTLKDIYKRQDALKGEIEQYLKNLIFHKLSKVKAMYKSVFDIDFGDIVFLYKAVDLRHDCVHRAGFDRDGHEVKISSTQIEELINGCHKLVSSIQNSLG